MLILLTDGKNNAGELTPEKASEIAAHAKLKVHTVAIGSKDLQIKTPFGVQNLNASAEIDEKSLKSIAENTGGNYFRAYNTQELIQIYNHIDQMEMIEKSNQSFRPIDEVYYWPLLIGLILCGILMSYDYFSRR